jgi:hypothetical protein
MKFTMLQHSSKSQPFLPKKKKNQEKLTYHNDHGKWCQVNRLITEAKIALF